MEKTSFNPKEFSFSEPSEEFLIKKVHNIWFEAELKSGSKCKIQICDKSKENNSLDFIIKDISSTYEKNLVFKIIEDSPEDKVVIANTTYNSYLIDCCRKLGGKWDADTKTWIFSESLKKEVEMVKNIFCSEKITIHIKAKQDLYSESSTIYFKGYEVCTAFHKEYVKISKNCILLEGDVQSLKPEKEWIVKISEGASFQIRIPVNLLKMFDYKDKYFEIKTKNPGFELNIKDILTKEP